MTNTTIHGQVPALHQYTSDLASKCQGLARCLTYNDKPLEAKTKHLLLEASHALDSALHGARWHRDHVANAGRAGGMVRRDCIDMDVAEMKQLFDRMLAVLPVLFREALAWGRAFGPEIPAHQWDDMRDDMAEQFTARAQDEEGGA